jgi:hypothetical protein
MATFGYHLDSESYSYETLLAMVRASGASHHLLMINPHGFFLGAGDILTIQRWLADCPNVTFIIRVYSASEGNWISYPSPAEYESHWRWVAKQFTPEQLARLVFDDCVNEPNLGGTDIGAARAYVARCVAMVKAASNAGIKFAVGAWSVGTPHESLFETEYMPLWKALAQYKQGISYHAYGAIPLEAGELVNIKAVLDAENAQSVMTKDRWSISHGGWLLARPFRFVEIFRKYGLGTPEIFITEGIVDNVFNGDTSDVKEAWKAKYGSPQYPDPRGVQAWGKFLGKMYPNKSLSYAVAELLRHAKRKIFYHKAFKTVILFAANRQWGYPDGKHREAGSNYASEDLAELRNVYLPLINAEIYNDEIPPKEPPMPIETWERIQVRSNRTDWTNCRDLPSTGAIVSKILPVWETVERSNLTSLAGWVKLRRVDNVVFYCLSSLLEFKAVEQPNPSPEPIFEMNVLQGTIRGNRALFTALAVILDTLLDAAENPTRVA